MGSILTDSTDYASVRRLVGMWLTPEELPDSVIADPVYLGVAEAQVGLLVPNWATHPQLDLIKIATAYLTASLLVPAMPDITSETWNGEHTYIKESRDLLALSDKYQQMGLSYLNSIAESATIDERMPTMFTTGGPTRRPLNIYAPKSSYDPR